MLQNFDVQGGYDFGRKNLPKLQEELKVLKLDGFIVPHEDEYQNEYLPDCNERLMWVSGFTGSAGAAIIMTDQAAIFVDGRYTLQVEAQVEGTLFEFQRLENNGVATWLSENVVNGQRIGYDPKLHTPSALKKISNAITSTGGVLVPLETNPIDQAWTDRPAPPRTQVQIQPLELAGLSVSKKREQTAQAISKINADKALITAPASIAWLLNIRGADVMCTPLALSTAIIASTIISAADPVALPKACKNKAEITATTQAHKRDGAVLIEFLHWLDTTAQSGDIDEIEAASKLENLRQATGKLKDLSFESISGAGSNGAIVHYRVSKATTKRLERGSLFLIDSGGQYVDGTTDVTRTVPIGTPTSEMRERFTLVLGSALDALARMALWAKGLDYDHGTGHGVGVYLGVHEGPQRISKAPNNIALKPGMIVSNEPGYYKTGEYGIRIETARHKGRRTSNDGV